MFRKLFGISILVCLLFCACTPVVPAAPAAPAAPAEPAAPAATAEPAASADKAAPAESDTNCKAMKTVAWLPGQLANPSQAFAWKMIQKHAAEYCFNPIVLDGKGDVQEQAKAINNAVAQKVDVIFVNPNDAKAIVPSLTEARKAGVVVGWFMSNPPAEAKESADFFVGVDDNQAGEFAAKAILEKFTDGADMVEIGGQAGHDAAIRRHDGFVSGIKDTKINVMEYKNPQQWDTAQAQTIAEDMITKYGDKIQAIFCHWDNGATGVINALKAKGGLENVMIVAVDGNKTGFDQVRSWPNYVSISQNIETITISSMKTANLFLEKDTTAKYDNIVPFDIITKASIDNFTPPEW